jgi:hypothetical protein
MQTIPGITIQSWPLFVVRTLHFTGCLSLLYYAGVVAEEMLHLSLAGNILLAVGGTPKLYDVKYMPSYPMLMPGRVPKLWLQLRKANKANLQTFLDVCIYIWRKFPLLI